ncbi:MAG: hypothetical protein V1914_00500 [archaeon]
MTKTIFKSKTFWINILAGIAIAIPGLGLPLSQKMQIWILAGVNILLRAITSEAIEISKKTKPLKTKNK